MVKAPEPLFKLVGGAPCLDFVNTMENWPDPAHHREHVATYDDLITWAHQAHVVTGAEAAALRTEATQDPAAAAASLGRAQDLRAALYDVMVAATHGRAAESVALALLNRFVAEFLGSSQLVPTSAGYTLAWAGAPSALDRVLWPIIHSAVDLLTSGRLDRLRVCQGLRCGWLFLDTSRGGRRRWCDMADCGNVAKVRRHRARHGATST